MGTIQPGAHTAGMAHLLVQNGLAKHGIRSVALVISKAASRTGMCRLHQLVLQSSFLVIFTPLSCSTYLMWLSQCRQETQPNSSRQLCIAISLASCCISESENSSKRSRTLMHSTLSHSHPRRLSPSHPSLCPAQFMTSPQCSPATRNECTGSISPTF